MFHLFFYYFWGTGKNSLFLFTQASAIRGFPETLTLFSPINSHVLHLTISGLSRKLLFTTQKEKIQDISEK